MISSAVRINKHKYIFSKIICSLKKFSAYLFQIAPEKSCEYSLIIHMKKFEMVKQKKHMCIMKSEKNCAIQGRFAQSLVSANHWLRGRKTYQLPWYLTLVSTNHASSNPDQGILLI